MWKLCRSCGDLPAVVDRCGLARPRASRRDVMPDGPDLAPVRRVSRLAIGSHLKAKSNVSIAAALPTQHQRLEPVDHDGRGRPRHGCEDRLRRSEEGRIAPGLHARPRNNPWRIILASTLNSRRRTRLSTKLMSQRQPRTGSVGCRQPGRPICRPLRIGSLARALDFPRPERPDED